MERITGQQSVRGRGGVNAGMCTPYSCRVPVVFAAAPGFVAELLTASYNTSAFSHFYVSRTFFFALVIRADLPPFIAGGDLGDLAASERHRWIFWFLCPVFFDDILFPPRPPPSVRRSVAVASVFCVVRFFGRVGVLFSSPVDVPSSRRLRSLAS